jgi:hypothetical protein
MRTTLILNDELMVVAKRVATARHTTLSAVVDEALRTALTSAGPKRQASPFHVPVFRGRGEPTDVSPRELARLVDGDELAPYQA